MQADAHTRTFFEYPLGESLEAKLLKELRGISRKVQGLMVCQVLKRGASGKEYESSVFTCNEARPEAIFAYRRKGVFSYRQKSLFIPGCVQGLIIYIIRLSVYVYYSSFY